MNRSLGRPATRARGEGSSTGVAPRESILPLAPNSDHRKIEVVTIQKGANKKGTQQKRNTTSRIIENQLTKTTKRALNKLYGCRALV